MDALQRALLEDLIDHAALFPPASMTMQDALSEDRAARESEYAWMVDRFVCPASRLGELDGLSAPVSVVLDGELPTAEQADAIETRLDAPRPDSRELLRSAQTLRELSDEVYFELVLEERWRDSVPATIGAIAAVGGRVKLRCGGLSVPSPEQVALVLVACHGARVVMKATAGLHHPLPSAGSARLSQPPLRGHSRTLPRGGRKQGHGDAGGAGARRIAVRRARGRGRAYHATRAVQGIRLVFLA